MPAESVQPLRVEYTPEFKRNLRALAKKYRHIRSDIQPLIDRLQAGEMKKPFTTIAVGVFALIALLHIFRLTFGWEVTFQGGVVPLWVSWLGIVIAAGLAIMLWRESR